MTENVKARAGTAWIVCGAVGLALALVALLTAPFAGDGPTVAGRFVGVALVAAIGVWLLTTGLRKRRLSR